MSALALPDARDRQTDGDRDPSDALRCSHSQSLSGAQNLMTLASGTPRKVSRGVVHPCTQVRWTSWLRMPRRSIFFKRMLNGCSTSPLTCSRQRPPKAREGDSHVDRRGCPRSIASHSVVSAPEAAIRSVIVPTFGVTFPVPCFQAKSPPLLLVPPRPPPSNLMQGVAMSNAALTLIRCKLFAQKPLIYPPSPRRALVSKPTYM